MAETATSPRYLSRTRSQQRPTTTIPMSAATTTAAAKATATSTSTTTITPSNPPAMTPFLSPRLASPQRRSNVPKTPSPNYFGFQTESSSFMSDSPQHAKTNWSPPSSAVRSTAAISPTVLPLDQNPDFDAFRRQSEGKAFNLAGLNSFKPSTPSSRPERESSDSRKSISHSQQPRPQTEPREIPSSSHREALEKIDTSVAAFSRSPKRLLSPGSATESNRRGSPPTLDHVDGNDRSTPASPEPPQRYRLPLDTQYRHATLKHRAETLPSNNESDETQLMVTSQHVVNLMESRPEQILLLDLRVATQYTASRIHGALNLCIPTTLLKRPSFNVQKLADTFQDHEQRSRFENWQSSSCIVVYDSNSALLKDAVICTNTIKKFRSEGYDGALYMIRGGFMEFAKRFPSYVDSGSDSTNATNDGDGPEVAPVVGGCPMPSTDKPANPFFGNIRQNMDLIGGVGQMAVKHPVKATKSVEDDYPEWLKDAANEKDLGKKVAGKFEMIERREKKRMEDALSGKISYGTPLKAAGTAGAVQIAGLEKGNKNRYNNIWPFEHSRVRLQGVPSAGCDYFNGTHIKASWSNKRYISTQAPIPATFSDFWNVVWQQDIRVIVMLTAEKEGAQVKAHNYWSQRQYGPLHLGFLSEKRASIEPSRIHRHQRRPTPVQRTTTMSQNPTVPLAQLESREEKHGERPYVVVRKFTLKHEKFPFAPLREITQLQYSSWPDFGAPAHPAHLLGLVEQCNAVVRATDKTSATERPPAATRPVLVHCSAGCGRTGTFCTVDTVIDMLKRQRISRADRQTTPMDVSEGHSSSSLTTGGPAHRQQNGDFFASHFTDSADNAGTADSWVNRDDQDLVEKTVEDFRHQRLSMVQSLRQYVLCYESIMEWLVEERQFPSER